VSASDAWPAWLSDEVHATLRRDPWFGQVSAPVAQALLSLATLRTLQPGERLFLRGDAPDGLYAVLSGAVRISGVTEAGKEAVLALMESPGWFGEIAVFDGLPRTHDAAADGPTRLLHVPQGALIDWLAREPVGWRELGVLMSLRLRLSFINLEDMALLPADARLVRRLLWLVEGSPRQAADGSCVLPISQGELGSMLSLSRQTTNQVLMDLQQRGVLRLSYGRIEVLDRVGLLDAARLSSAEARILRHWRLEPSAG